MVGREYEKKAFELGREIEAPPDYGRASRIFNRLSEITGIPRERLEPRHYYIQEPIKGKDSLLASYSSAYHAVHYNGKIEKTTVEHERFHALQHILGLEKNPFAELAKKVGGGWEPVAMVADGKDKNSFTRYENNAATTFWSLMMGLGIGHEVVNGSDLKTNLIKIGCYTCAGLLALGAGPVKKWWKSKNLRKFAQTATDDELMAVIMANSSGPLFPDRMIKKLEKQGLLKDGSFTGKAKVKIENMAPTILEHLEWKEEDLRKRLKR